ncbi:ABC transporter permease [candidate division KSB1 bacterium]
MEKKIRPPRLAEFLISYMVNERTGYGALGDYEETFHRLYIEKGKSSSYIHYWLRVFTLFPYFLKESIYWSFSMINNYFKIATRIIKKYPGFSAINVIGLTMSMSISLLILLTIIDQKDFDTFHEKKGRIYRVIGYIENKASRYQKINFATTPSPLGPELLRTSPAIESIVRMRKTEGRALFDDKNFQISGLYAENSFFDIFSFELLFGDPRSSLGNPFSIVLTLDKATTIFGDEDPLGKVIQFEEKGNFTVTGVIKPLEKKTHLQFDALFSFKSLESIDADEEEPGYSSWENRWQHFNYLLLNKGSGPEEVEAILPGIVDQYCNVEEQDIYELSLQHLNDINLGPNLSNELSSTAPGQVIWFFSGTIIFLMAIASFNYITLSIARAVRRAKEVGLRKVIGAHRSQLIRQFIAEAVVITLFALIAAVLLLFWLVPEYNSLSMNSDPNTKIPLELLWNIKTILILTAFAVFAGFCAGVYPAVFLSSFLPAVVLKGVSSVKGFSRLTVRKVLIVFQFTVSLILIIGIMVFQKQFNFMLNADHGFSTENILIVNLQGNSFERFENEISSFAEFVSVGGASEIPLSGSISYTYAKSEKNDEDIIIMASSVDDNFIPALDLKLIAGTNMVIETGELDKNAAVINESAVAAFGFTSPQDAVGQFIRIGKDNQYRIAGVLQDYHTRDFSNQIEPKVLRYVPDQINYAVLEYVPGAEKTALSTIQERWKKIDILHPADIRFLEDMRVGRYTEMNDPIKVVKLVIFFTLFISCLGLLGMATYSAETRIKEIGIRKVMGASNGNLIFILTREFISLVVIAIVIAVPLAWFGSSQFLRLFAKKTELSPMIFAGAALLVLAAAVITTGTQTIRAARSNPAETLKYE